MKKLAVILLAYAVFMAILIVFIVPQQGGLISANQLNLGVVDDVSELPIQDVGLGNQGRSIMIAVGMLSHILIANLQLGGSWVMAGSESLYVKTKKERYDKLGRSLALFNLILFSTGSTFAVGGMLFFFSLYPAVSAQLFHVFWWPLFIELLTFGVEIFCLYTYYFTWDKIPRRWHQGLAYTNAISVFVQTLLINMVASAMLTPGSTTIDYTASGLLTMTLEESIAWWFNPSMWILTFHRAVAGLSYFGFLLATLSMFHYKDKNDPVAKKHWDWQASYGIAWGLAGLLLQPILGMIYVQVIQNDNYSTFSTMMNGPRAWEFLMLVGLFAVLFLVLLVYFVDRRETILSKPENAFLHKTFNIFLYITAICTFFLVQPAWIGGTTIDAPGALVNPLGKMTFKYIALLTMSLIALLVLLIDTRLLKDEREGEWGKLSKTSRWSAMLTGVLGMWMVIVMGFTRESGRAPYTIMGIFPVEGGSSSSPTPISVEKIFIVWIVITVFILLIFWLVSRVTSYHPEEAEK